jgi:hypothetical protein
MPVPARRLHPKRVDADAASSLDATVVAGAVAVAVASDHRVIDVLPEFLFDLARRADKRDKVETSKRTIGGVFILQNMTLWESLSGCTCWPV